MVYGKQDRAKTDLVSTNVASKWCIREPDVTYFLDLIIASNRIILSKKWIPSRQCIFLKKHWVIYQVIRCTVWYGI